ncbi:MAG: hypothetical protein A2Z16_03895 [Chloroflexi bacterium RBG_16_54_18]|nr:MAG: hypothetical protein A2Z16_03895 [Chloroflexi bacterium RBG_16_54_18]
MKSLSRKKSDTRWLITAVFLILALLLFLPGIHWGVPEANAANRVHPWEHDEIAPLGFGEFYFSLFSDEPRFDPRYPLGAYYVQLLFVTPYLLILAITGQIQNFTSSYPYGLVDPVSTLRNLTLIGRLPSLLASAAVIATAYRTAGDIWDETAGRLAGIFVLLIYPMAYYSRTSNVDMLALLWCTLGLWVFARILRFGLTYRRATLLGVLAALATATKDPSWAVFFSLVPYFVWTLIWDFQENKHINRSQLKMLLAGLTSALLVYAVFSGAILNLQRFQSHLYFIVHGSPEGVGIMNWHYSNAATFSGYLTIIREMILAFVYSLGVINLLLGLIGVFISRKENPASLWMAAPVIGIILLIILPVRFVMLRFVLIPAYILAIFAARGAAQWLKTPSAWFRRLGIAVISLGIAWSVLALVDFNYQLWNDSRYGVQQWITPYLKPGDRVGCADYLNCVRLPYLPEFVTSASLPRQKYLVVELPPAADFEWLIFLPHEQEQGEEFLSDDVWQGLIEGRSNYQLVYHHATNSFLNYRPLPQVSPPVWVFLRKDLLERVCPNLTCPAVTR